MEISAPGVTKGSALIELATELGVDATDVIAFGDMPNDLPMLTWAGHSYAMANGHPAVPRGRRPRGAGPRRGRRRGGPGRSSGSELVDECGCSPPPAGS